MTIYVSGDSNSVRRNGWVQALADDMRVTADVRNISIGGAPSHMSLLRAIKQSDLGPGDVFIWAYGINDALYVMKAGYTCDELIWCIRHIIRICAEAGAAFAPMIFQPRHHSQLPRKSEYRTKLHSLFVELGIPYFDIDESYLTTHPRATVLPLRFYEDYLHYAQTPEVTEALVDGAVCLITQARVPSLGSVTLRPVRLIEDFRPVERGLLENSAVGQVTTWQPGTDGLRIALPGNGRIFVTTTRRGGAWNLSFGDLKVAISTSFADRQFNRTMLKFISPSAVTREPFHFKGAMNLGIEWVAEAPEVLADFWFLPDPEPEAMAGQEARLVSIMIEED